jgi:DNA-binding transcriptional MerR regulator
MRSGDTPDASLPPEGEHLTLDALCTLTDTTLRNARYYIQIGLVPRPNGEKRGAYYTRVHAEALVKIRRWQAEGLSLARIGELLAAGASPGAPLPSRARAPGSVEVWSHLQVADGIELMVEPGRAGLAPGELRRLMADVMAAYQRLKGT